MSKITNNLSVLLSHIDREEIEIENIQPVIPIEISVPIADHNEDKRLLISLYIPYDTEMLLADLHSALDDPDAYDLEAHTGDYSEAELDEILMLKKLAA